MRVKTGESVALQSREGYSPEEERPSRAACVRYGKIIRQPRDEIVRRCLKTFVPGFPDLLKAETVANIERIWQNHNESLDLAIVEG